MEIFTCFTSRRSLALGRIVLLIGISFAACGCVVLPLPNYRVEGYGVKSRVVDAETGAPIVGAKIIDAANPNKTVKTDKNGDFHLLPNVQWHFGYLWGVLSYPIWPFTGDVVLGDRSIRIISPGYEEVIFDMQMKDEGNVFSNTTIEKESFVAGSLKLRKHQPP